MPKPPSRRNSMQELATAMSRCSLRQDVQTRPFGVLLSY
jgi:hypothetical protein